MTIEEIIAIYGTPYAFCRETKIAYGNVSFWQKNGCIPLKMQWRIEALTNGKLKARLEDARPKRK